MKRLGIALAALLLMGACGGGSGTDQSTKSAKTSQAPTGIGMATACGQVKQATEDIGGDGALGAWAKPTFSRYGEELVKIADMSQTDVADTLNALAEQSTTIGQSDSPTDEMTSEWANRYVAVQDACIRADAPIRRLD